MNKHLRGMLTCMQNTCPRSSSGMSIVLLNFCTKMKHVLEANIVTWLNNEKFIRNIDPALELVPVCQVPLSTLTSGQDALMLAQPRIFSLLSPL